MKCSQSLALKALLLILTTAFPVATCLAQDLGPGVTAPPLSLTVKPDISTPIYVKTLPNAVCTLQPKNATSNAAQTLLIYADREGTVNFNAYPQHFESDMVGDLVQFQLQCRVGATVNTYPIELRVSLVQTGGFPFPPGPPPIAGGTIRPALTADQLKTFTYEQFLEKGYPPPPDPKQAPQAYASWLRAITEPATLISPQIVSRPDIVHSNINGHHEKLLNWSGFVVRAPNNSDPYDNVEGQWLIPAVVSDPHPIVPYVDASLWVGLDGDPQVCCGGDLVQAGTDSWAAFGCAIGIACIQMQTSNPWTEIFPIQPTAEIANLHVNAGDWMYVRVWIADFIPGSVCTTVNIVTFGCQAPPSPLGSTVFFYLQDVSTQAAIWPPIAYPLPPGFFHGGIAEWIMERPGANGVFTELAHFSTTASGPNPFGVSPNEFINSVAFMSGAWAVSANTAAVEFNGTNDLPGTIDLYNVEMVSCTQLFCGSHSLSAASGTYPHHPDWIVFGWGAFY